MILVHQQRLWDSLMEMATIGATARGGSCRLALSADEVLGRQRFIRWCEEAGCDVRIDPIGNVFARRPGTQPDAPAVMCGSHLDTQPLGGRFDGVYGVLAGLEAIRTLNEHGVVTRHPIGRLGEPKEVAALVTFLLSPRASFITGSYHLVDGAYAAQ